MSVTEEYHIARTAQDIRAEAVTGGNATETASYFGTDGENDAVEKRLTFRDFLIAGKGERAPDVYTDGYELGRTHAGTGTEDDIGVNAILAAMSDAEAGMWMTGYAAGLERPRRARRAARALASPPASRVSFAGDPDMFRMSGAQLAADGSAQALGEITRRAGNRAARVAA